MQAVRVLGGKESDFIRIGAMRRLVIGGECGGGGGFIP